jgi:hypothetical protein
MEKSTVLLLLAGWFLPVGVVCWLAKEAGKDIQKVLLAGLLLGWIGAAFAAAILPAMSAEEAASKRARTSDPLDSGSWRIIWIGIGVAFAVQLGAIAAVMFLV